MASKSQKKPNSKPECPICFEEVPPSKVVTCFCGYQLCRDCCIQWLSDKPDDPFCMECREKWLHRFLWDQLGKWMKGHRKGSYNYALKEALLQKILAKSEEAYRVIGSYPADQIQYKLKVSIRSRIRDLKAKKEKLVRYYFSCSQSNCRGMVDSSYQCVLCKTQYCSQCREVKHEGKCDPNTVKTVHNIQKYSQSCPKCSVPITKIDGCDQMWCTQCHIFFDWKTGRVIEASSAHNPHAVAWMRKHGTLPRERGDVICGGIPNDPEIRRVFGETSSEQARITSTLIDYSRSISEHLDWRIHYQVSIRDTPNHDMAELVQYLRGKIDLSTLRDQIFRNYRYQMRQQVILDILNLLGDLAPPIFRRLIERGQNDLENPRKIVYEFFIEINRVREFLNESMNIELKRWGARGTRRIEIYSTGQYTLL